jgi:hypothetical protein
VIVLDEQCSRETVRNAVAAWYPGAVRFITELRPGTIIKDEAIPSLLRHAVEPTLVTINESDFWRIAPASPVYCIVCLTLTEVRGAEVSAPLRQMLRHPDFRTKAKRMGKIVRITAAGAAYYGADA